MTASPAAKHPSRWTAPWIPPALGLACMLTSLAGGFAYDDEHILLNNPKIRDATNFNAIWLTDWWSEPGREELEVSPLRDRLYRPLTVFSFTLNYAVHGLAPFGYHVVNVALHVVACALVQGFGWLLLRESRVAAAAAIFFAVHPVHVEAVANVVGRAEVLCALGLLGGLIALLPPAGLPGWFRTGIAAGAFLLALLSKETAICYPALAALTLAWRGGWERQNSAPADMTRMAWGPIAARLVLLLLPLAIYFPMRMIALEGHLVRAQELSAVLNPLFGAGPAGRTLGALTVLGHYARLTLAPATLAIDYGMGVMEGRPVITGVTVMGLGAAAALLVAVAGWRARSWWWRSAALLAAMFLASYLLISNTVILIGVSVAERLFYWPSVPALLLVSLVGVQSWDRLMHRSANVSRLRMLLSGCLLVGVSALGLRSAARCTDWHSSERLFAVDVETFPRNVHLNKARARQLVYWATQAVNPGEQSTLLDEAERRLTTALDVHDADAEAMMLAGQVAALRGDTDMAIRQVRAAAQLMPRSTLILSQLAALEGREAALAAGVEAAEQSVASRPADSALRLAAARAHLAVGDYVSARHHLEQAVALAPGDAEAWAMYGQALLLAQRNEDAADALRRAVALNPRDWESMTNLASALVVADPEQGLLFAARALALQPDDMRTRVNHAEALAAAGRRDEAIRAFEAIARDLPANNPLQRAVRARAQELSSLR